jgi:hypothetical protein
MCPPPGAVVFFDSFRRMRMFMVRSSPIVPGGIIGAHRQKLE